MMICLEDVTKVYKVGVERIRALDGLCLEVAENEYLAVMGPSGSGKSTLLNIVGCLDRPTSGAYRLDGRPIHDMSAAALARIRNERIGFVFQTFELLPRLSALNNAALPLIYSGLGRRGRRKRAEQVLRRVGLGDRIRHRPSQLSAGEKQRVAIARALIVHPRILLADEPTGNLDSQMGGEIIEILHGLNQVEHATIVMVTHDSRHADKTKRVVRLFDGRQVQ